MPLSEEEQRLLEQMEQALAAEDPKFASTLRGATLRARLRRQVVLSAVAFVAGTGLLMVGVIVQMTPVSVVGFVVMLGAAYLFITAWRRGGEVDANEEAPQTSRRPSPRTPRAASGGSFMDRMEERWRRRRDDEP
ncbi:MAG: DUF3040 domain-containing protein [Nocardioidaceae bacterium]|nr:DUF3040 domain-containing protein [Nocardioidaceae bacterium]